MNQNVLKYGGFVIAFFVALITVIEPGWAWFSPELGWAIASLFGIGGLTALRTFIESEGWKTYGLLGGQVVLAILLSTNNIDLALYAKIMVFLETLTGATLMQAQAKAIQ